MALQIPPMVYPVTVFVELLSIAFDQAGRPRGLRATSWLRSSAGNEQLLSLGAVRNSLHKKGLAIDIVGPRAADGTPGPGLVALGAAWARLGLDALFSAQGNLHLELDGSALRRLGLSFKD